MPTRRRPPWWLLPAVPAVLLWVVVGQLLLREVTDLVQGAETEHSPLRATALLLPPAGVLTWAAVRLRRR